MSAKHSYNAYSNGCRCAVCRVATREYRREHRAKVRARLDEVEHGLRWVYDAGCRCASCTDAHSKAHADYRARTKGGNA